MDMNYLPCGYYVVLPPTENIENPENPIFSYGEHTYNLRMGNDAFFDIGTAQQNAKEKPSVVLPGLPYSRFDSPVIIFASGNHKIDKHIFDRSLTLLGAAAGIAPDIYFNDGRVAPVSNENRHTCESVLVGSFWFGNMFCTDSPEGSEPISSITFDGFTLKAARIIVNVKKSPDFVLTLRNLIYKGPCGKTLISASSLPADSPCKRSIILDEINVRDYDGYDYGGSFIRPCVNHVSIHHLLFSGTDKPFGFSDFSHRFKNSPGNSKDSLTEIKVSDCYFENISAAGGISLTSDSPLSLSFNGCGFNNASAPQEAVFQPFLGESSELIINSCRIKGSNCSPAVVKYIGNGKVIYTDNIEEGFDTAVIRLPDPPTALSCNEKQPAANQYQSNEEDPHVILTDENFSDLETLYHGRTAKYGDLHVHSDSGGTSDGKTPFYEYTRYMDKLSMDFAAVVDHKQMRHMFLPEFDKTRMICGTEPGTTITSGLSDKVRKNEIHYNMIFNDCFGLIKTLEAFPEFEWTGSALEGSFKYPKFTRERFVQLAEYIRSLNGCLVHAHPKQIMASSNPLDFYFGEHTYIEVLHSDAYTYESYADYKLWCDMLSLGKHVYAAGGSDAHGALTNSGVSTFYAQYPLGEEYVNLMFKGDFTVGYAGIMMCLDKSPMGAETEFNEDAVLSVKVGDSFAPCIKPDTVYELRVLSDKGILYRQEWSGKGNCRVRIKAQKRAFYRAEMFDITHSCPVAIGNPIFIRQ